MNNASTISDAETSNSKSQMSNEDQSLFDALFLIIMETISAKAEKDMTVSGHQTQNFEQKLNMIDTQTLSLTCFVV